MPMKIKGQAPQRLARLRQAQTEHIDLRVNAAAGDAVDVYLYDVIGWPFIEAQDLLYQIPTTAKTINVHINSPGGDVFEGMAIYNFLTGHRATVNITVDALAASSASLVAMAGQDVKMAPASFVMIHNPWTMMAGDAEDLRKEADLLDKISGVFADAYAARTGRSRQEMLDLMQAETWYTADEAIEAKLATGTVGDQGGAQASAFDLSVFANVPENIRNRSAARQARAQNTPSKEETDMDKKLRALLERLGLSKDATETQAWAFLAEVDVDQIQTKEERDQIQAALDQSTNPQGGKDTRDPDQAAREAIQAERKRVSEIKEAVKIAGLGSEFAEDLVDRDMSVDAARQAIFAKMKETNPPIGAGGIQVGEHEQDKFRKAVTDGLAFRAGARPSEPAPGFEEFRAASIENIARRCLERAGVDTRSMGSRDQVARAILRQAAAGGFSTDDFSSIFMDVANKSMLRAYQEAPNTWRPFVNVVSASDFKTIYGVSLSEAPDLELVNEHGEYKSGSLSDSQESYSVSTFGKIIYLTRQMIVNDDLRAFTRLPQLMGAAARRKEGDLVWAKITGNPVMSDGNALFSAAHSNVATAGLGPVDTAKLSAGRSTMRRQTGPGGATLDIQPRFLLTPVEQETNAEVILRSTALPEDNQSSGVYNPWAGRLTPIAEPRLDNDSTKQWYLVGDPNQVDTIEVAYLDGREEPYTEEEVQFERDAVGYKIRHDFGCGVMDHRGFYRNAGE